MSFDTSSLAASVSISDSERLIGEYYCDARLTHSQTIMPMAENLLKNTRTSINDIDLFAVTKGPGSFTGLRIGLSAVKGIAQITEKPCLGISTLESLSYNLVGCKGISCAVMDARCSQVYTAMFDLDNGNARLTPDEAISLEELQKRIKDIKKSIILVGDGAMLCYNSFGKDLDNVSIAPSALRLQHSYSTAVAAQKHLADGEKPIQAEELLPSYLRLSQAERERLKKSQNERKVK
jgi:tRNA threonylcarbamoyladenosine biosynthesis protein TsaB